MSSRSCSLCGLNGHNSRTCVGSGVMLFGVRLTDGPMRKSASMNNLSNLSQYEHSDPAEVAAEGFDGYVSDDLVHSSSNARERKRGQFYFLLAQFFVTVRSTILIHLAVFQFF